MPIFGFYPDNSSPVEKELEKKVFRYSLIFPLFFTGLFWVMKIMESIFGFESYKLGIYPLYPSTLTGILTAPLVHANYEHLIANSAPFLVLSAALSYFYRGLSYRIFWFIYFFSGRFVWIFGRPAWHIGASGVIYGMASFLFFSGVFRSDTKLLTIALIVAFLYGGMFWGIFPFKEDMSWEAHFGGAIAGLFLAVIYRNRGPRRKEFEWETSESEDDEEFSDKTTDQENQNGPFPEK
ncbi:MAG: rhomboid family intramembrane serine protease [Bacteroidota bacterium]|nr:rhomboid family intramembrane serine protease [Bacteroidota bacterium]